MRTTIFRTIRYFLLALLAGFTTFFFWASSANWPKEQYAQFQKYEFPNAHDAAQDSILTVIAYNIGYLSGMTNNSPKERTSEMFFANQELACKALQEGHPAIIALQEVDYDAHRSFYIDQMRVVARAALLPYAAQAVNWDKQYVPFPYFPPSIHFGQIISGQAILSAFPLVNHQRTVLERPASNPFYYDAFYIDRLLQTVTVQWQGREIVVMNVHLEAYNQETRARQSAYVLAQYHKYAQEGLPVILLGDFNSTPPMATGGLTTVAVFLEEPSLASAVPSTHFNQEIAFTFPADAPKEQIDYIFYTKAHFETISWEVMKSAGTASDHLPLLWKARWKK